MKIYLNDVIWHSGSSLTKTIAQTNYMRIGSGITQNNTTPENYWQGIATELRLSNIARSDSWIKAESLALKNSLLTISGVILNNGNSFWFGTNF